MSTVPENGTSPETTPPLDHSPPQGTAPQGIAPQGTAPQGTAPQGTVRSPLSDGEWHRLHPLTPLFRGGFFLVVVAGIVIANLRDRLIATFLPWVLPEAPSTENWRYGDPVDWIFEHDLIVLAAFAVLGIVLLLIGWFYLSWRWHTFRITEDRVEVRSGILFRTQRRAPLDRVQGVNLTRPLFARLVGMAKLEVVGAGLDANVKLDYLSTGNAEDVRSDILGLASGARLAKADPSASPARASRTHAVTSTVSHGINGLIAGAEAAPEEPESVVTIPPGRLIISHLLSGWTLALIALVIGVAVAAFLGATWALFSLIPAIIGFGAYWFSSIIKALRYSIAPTRDGLRITFGFFTTVTETLPPGRVHAVEVSQSIFWRPAGWWTVRINRLTGRSAADTTTDQFTTVLPVGTREDVERVLRLLMPGLPEEEWPLIFEHGILGPRADDPYSNTPGRARIIRIFSWRRNGYLVSPHALLLRRGVIWRKLGIFPFARLQSIALHQGPVDRMLRVVTARVQTVSGPVWGTLAAIDRDGALRLFQDVADSAVAAASVDRSHRWGEGP
ncbi:MAG TPA: PH domain-containing protein [Microbacterium sp.]|uniref:PH domain-containing protein n=1 Tax=Microbacterium sp. TaxID=51671 RepID=UPI002B661C23|nr:PH domain-containing protein [Microbacterium sp.]HWI31106.1 PH domain-containing protein [Microbacterium sp.]